MGTKAERIEWIAGGLSALVVLGMIGFFLQEALGGADRLPDLAVSVDPVPAEGATQLRYRLRNDGGRAATSVTLSLTLAGGERRSVVVDEVPAHSEVTGGIQLPAGVGPADAVLGVDGYVDP